MTTNRTAATWRSHLSAPFAATVLLMSLALAGCESGSTLLGDAKQPPLTVAETSANKTVTVAIAPVLGVPDATSKQIMSQLAAGLDKSKFTLVTQPAQLADYTLRGYATAAKDPAAKDKGASKLSYFFDVMDRSGKKINRIAGDEMLGIAPAGKDVWNSVTPQISQSVATKTVTAFTTSIPAIPAPGSQSPASSSIASATGHGSKPTEATPDQVIKAAASPADAAAAGRPLGSPSSADKPTAIATLVPSVTGAPGDGSQSLAAALQKELSRNGVALSDGTAQASYRVEGKVTVGADKDGKQPIEISWNVKDPQGKRLGTVTQKNEIPQGSLDGAWGKTADAAAAAAAQGIIKLLPGQKTTQ